MPGLSKVIVLDPDARASRQVRLGFEREGVPVAALPADAAGLDLPGSDTGLVVVGGGNGQALELIRVARKWLDGQHVDAPLVFAGRGVLRSDAEAAGADEVVLRPAYLRDVVTIGRLLRGVPAASRSHLIGSLVELTGVFTLVRAFAALGRSATLTLVRGLRRGEIRFYHGEVTSAQVGMIHGQAALHQLLLWTDARFDYHHEDVVRRHQIPLSHHELFADAERFLEGMRDSSGALSPSMVLEQDAPRVQSFGKQIPTEVYGVLRMFDGYRVLADVLEDSPYRVFETLRVAQRAIEAGLLRVVDKPRPRVTWRAFLAIEDWLVGGEARGATGDSGPIAKSSSQDSGPTTRDSGPVAHDARGKAARKSRRKKKRRGATPPAVPTATPGPKDREIDWGALVPRVVGAEVGPLSGVVPASHVSGEIVARSRVVTHATLDEQPTIVFDEAAELALDANARAAAEADARARAAAERAEAERLAAEALAQAADEARAKAAAALAEAEARAQEAAAQAEAARRAAEAAAQADAERRAAEAAAQADAERRAAEAAELADAERRAAEAAELADAERRAAEAAELADAERRAAEAAELADAERRAAEAAELADAEARASAIRLVAATVSLSSEPSRVVDDLLLDDTKPERLLARPKLTEPITSVTIVETPGVTIAETPTATIVVHDSVVVETSGETTARLTATPVTRIIGAGAAAVDSAPSMVTDEASDGVIVQHITTADTAPVMRRRLPSDPPENDRPEDAMGEITTPFPRTTREPRRSEPSILVADLAAIHAAVSEAVSEIADDQITTPTTANAASPAREAEVVTARHDAVAFNEVEEAFFRAGHDKEVVAVPTPVVESFDDLDEGYQPVGFWDRLRGKASRQPARPAKPTKPDDPDQK